MKKGASDNSRPQPTRMATRRQSRKVEVPKLEPVVAAENVNTKDSVQADEEMPKLLPFDAIKPKRRGSTSTPKPNARVETLDLGLHNRTFESGEYEIPFNELSDSDMAMGLGDDMDFPENDSIVAALHAGIGDGNLLSGLHTNKYDDSSAAKLDEFSKLGSYNADEIEACFSGSGVADSSVNLDKNSQEITPAGDVDNAFNELIREMSEKYQVDVSVVGDHLPEEREDAPLTLESNPLPRRPSFPESETQKDRDVQNASSSQGQEWNTPSSSTVTNIEDSSHTDEHSPTDDKSIDSHQRSNKKRPFTLESGLSGSYWQIESNNDSSWAVRPKRSKAGSNMKSLIRSEKSGSLLTYESELSPKKPNEKHVGKGSPRTPASTSTATAANSIYDSKSSDRSMEGNTSRLMSKKTTVGDHMSNEFNSAEDSGDDLQLITEELSNFCVRALPKCLVVKKVKTEYYSGKRKKKFHYPSNQVSNTKHRKIVKPSDSLHLVPKSKNLVPLRERGDQFFKAVPFYNNLKSDASAPTSTINQTQVGLPKPKHDETKLISNSATMNSTLDDGDKFGSSCKTATAMVQEIPAHSSSTSTFIETPEFDLESVAGLIPESGLVEDGEKPGCSRTLLNDDESSNSALGGETAKEKENMFGISARSTINKMNKKWFEDEEPEVIRLGNNKLLINNKLVRINYTTYTKESDVVLDFDPEALVQYERKSSKEMQDSNCLQPHCRLGCVCDSLSADVDRSHCGRPKCFFGCWCPFKFTPAVADDSDIRSRLRPRVSLLNWKELGRTMNEPSDVEFTVKAKTLASTKRQSFFEAGNLITNRSKRNVQPPSRLRNEFVMDEGKRPSHNTGKPSSQIQKEKVQNVKSENKFKILNLKHKGEIIRPPKQKQVIRQPEREPIHQQQPRPRPAPLAPRLLPPLPPSVPQRFRPMQRKFDLKSKSNKPIISARYLYNHSLLRRMHKCGPCFVRLTRLTNCAPTQRIKTTFFRRQVAVKSTSKGNLFRKNIPLGQPMPNQYKMKATASPLKVVKMREENTCCIIRENGTILSFLRWSIRRECVPTANVYAPMSGDSAAMYPWLKLPVPPMDQAWMFYELDESFKLSHHVVIPELRVILRTKTLEARFRETEFHGKTQKLDVGDYTMVSRRNKYGTIYIVKNMPNTLICGPLPKKRLKPLIKPYRRDTLDLLKYSLRKYPKIHKYQVNNAYNFDKSEESDSDTIELDSISRDWNLIPPNVMLKHYKDFMIHVTQSELPSEEPEDPETEYDYEYDLDEMFGKERSVSPSDLIVESEDPHGSYENPQMFTQMWSEQKFPHLSHQEPQEKLFVPSKTFYVVAPKH